jgi:hypothetical protein
VSVDEDDGEGRDDGDRDGGDGGEDGGDGREGVRDKVRDKDGSDPGTGICSRRGLRLWFRRIKLVHAHPRSLNGSGLRGDSLS